MPGARLAYGLLSIWLFAGCYVPGGGWTVRSGIDLRTCRKPALYVETVDTRWDEWNRVARHNLGCAPGYPAPVPGDPLLSADGTLPRSDSMTVPPTAASGWNPGQPAQVSSEADSTNGSIPPSAGPANGSAIDPPTTPPGTVDPRDKPPGVNSGSAGGSDRFQPGTVPNGSPAAPAPPAEQIESLPAPPRPSAPIEAAPDGSPVARRWRFWPNPRSASQPTPRASLQRLDPVPSGGPVLPGLPEPQTVHPASGTGDRDSEPGRSSTGVRPASAQELSSLSAGSLSAGHTPAGRTANASVAERPGTSGHPPAWLTRQIEPVETLPDPLPQSGTIARPVRGTGEAGAARADSVRSQAGELSSSADTSTPARPAPNQSRNSTPTPPSGGWLFGRPTAR